MVEMALIDKIKVLIENEGKSSSMGIGGIMEKNSNKDLGTLCLYQHEFATNNIVSYLGDYYKQ